MKKPRLIPVGRIARPHGVRGALKLYPYGETLAGQSSGDKLFLNSASRRTRSELTFVSLRSQGRVWVAQFEELTNVDEAREFVGEEVFLPEDRLPPTGEGEYYHYQLIGLSVETLQGRQMGTLRAIIETGGSDVYVVDFDGSEILIPAVEGVILDVDLVRQRMVIDPPEGLIDDL